MIDLPQKLRIAARSDGNKEQEENDICLLLLEAADEIERLQRKIRPQTVVYIDDPASLAIINSRRAEEGLPPL